MKAMPPLARVLPLEAALSLQRAAQIQNSPTDRLARAKAIDHAAYVARLKHPHLFHPVPQEQQP